MSSSNPLVSVIIPTHNRSELLLRSVRTVLAQSYKNLELIVVDDASTDDTQEVLAKIDDERLICLRREKGGSAAAARNKGLEIARGELVAFQDDDDIWMLEKLERQVAHLLAQDDDVGLCVCSAIWINRGREMTYMGRHKDFEALNYELGKTGDEGLIATPGWLVKRKYLDAAGPFDPEVRSWDDWELGLRLWKLCRFTHLREILLIQDRTRGSLMIQNKLAFAGDMQVIMRKHSDFWADNPVVTSRHYYFIGNCLCRFEDRAKGIPWLRRSIETNPKNWRSRAALLAAHLNLYSAVVSTLSFLRRWRNKWLRRPVHAG